MSVQEVIGSDSCQQTENGLNLHLNSILLIILRCQPGKNQTAFLLLAVQPQCTQTVADVTM